MGVKITCKGGKKTPQTVRTALQDLHMALPISIKPQLPTGAGVMLSHREIPRSWLVVGTKLLESPKPWEVSSSS